MNISQALKEKNKKVSKLNKIWNKLASYNSVTKESERPYDIDKLWAEYNSELESLVDLKTRIHLASSPVRKDIFYLSELKNKINQVKNLSTENGISRSRFSTESVEFVAHFNISWKDSQLESIEAEIEAIQEKLDTFNHTTKI